MRKVGRRNQGVSGGDWLGTVIGLVFLHAMSPFASVIRTTESFVQQIPFNYSNIIFGVSFCPPIFQSVCRSPCSMWHVSHSIDCKNVNFKSLCSIWYISHPRYYERMLPAQCVLQHNCRDIRRWKWILSHISGAPPPSVPMCGTSAVDYWSALGC